VSRLGGNPNFGPASTAHGGMQSYSEAAMDLRWVWSGATARPAALQQWNPGVLWSGSRQGVGMAGESCPGCTDMNGKLAAWYLELMPLGGGQQAKKIIGTTRDSAGSVLGNCIVQGFVTSGDVYVGECTSDPAGYFELPTPYTGAHYLVCYKAGSPDVAGTSLNTLIPV